MKIVFILTSALLVAARVRADDERLATLQVRGETYTNVTVTAVSATEIFLHIAVVLAMRSSRISFLNCKRNLISIR